MWLSDSRPNHNLMFSIVSDKLLVSLAVRLKKIRLSESTWTKVASALYAYTSSQTAVIGSCLCDLAENTECPSNGANAFLLRLVCTPTLNNQTFPP